MNFLQFYKPGPISRELHLARAFMLKCPMAENGRRRESGNERKQDGSGPALAMPALIPPNLVFS